MEITRKFLLGVVFAIMALVGRISLYITTPLFLDYFTSQTKPANYNSSSNTTDWFEANVTISRPISERMSALFLMILQWGTSSLIFGLILISMMIYRPGSITEVERRFPKRRMLVIGVSQGVSSILFNFALSGSRTAPYLQALLSNCNIPIQFTVRFFILRKRPTLLKLCCAIAVVLAEFMCLIPTILPGLEPSQEKHDEGGASGPARILWHMCFVLSQVPFAVANSIMEKSVQEKAKAAETDDNDDTPKTNQLNLVFFLFWWTFFVTLTILVFFWTDIIPGFGSSPNFTVFFSSFWFDVKALFGSVSIELSLLGWFNMLAALTGCLSFAGLMRYTEGANFVIILLTLRTPILFFFWTLFVEQPFHWAPHIYLSFWLSLAAIVIMLPAVVIYNLGSPEVVMTKTPSSPSDESHSATSQSRGLLEDDEDDADPPYIYENDPRNNYRNIDIQTQNNTT